MKQELAFTAPWQTALKLISAIASLILIGISIMGTLRNNLWISLPPQGLLAACLFFTVRGYVLGPEALFVKRLGWNSRIPLAGLQSVEVDPRAMNGSIRTCGNGGLFSISGWYWSRRQGAFRAFATDTANSVVLRFPRQTIVVTPGEPERFATELRRIRNLQTFQPMEIPPVSP